MIRRGIGNWRAHVFTLILIPLFFASAFSAGLPDAEDVLQKPTYGGVPDVVGPKGPLPPEKSQAVFDQLQRDAGPRAILDRHIRVAQEAGKSPLIVGNKVSLLVDGPATYDAMFKAIRAAKDHIHLETFIFDADEAGRRFSDLFLKKRAEGVQVRILYDSAGCRTTPAEFFERLREGGVEALEFNPINPVNVREKWLLNNRDHRKILIVDGRIAFTGGVNISAVYSRTSSSPEGPSAKAKDDKNGQRWRDTHVKIEGPAVAEFQKLFWDSWHKQKGKEPSGGKFFPPLKKEGDILMQVIASASGSENRLTYIMYVSAFSHAEKSIHLTNSYFVPDDQTMKALTDAARRGVDVKMILPGSSDIGWAFYAGRSYYSRLLEAGVKIYERQRAMLHAKTAVIDGVWSTVGSTNMDLWSFMRNDEVNAVFLGREISAELEAQFASDLKESKQITLSQWEKRSYIEMIKEEFRRLFFYFL